MARIHTRWQAARLTDKPQWWAYCAKHLRGYNREVRDGHVWWLGTTADGVSVARAE
jgi:hypothetical protein